MPNRAKLCPCNTTLSYAAAILCRTLSSYTFASHHHTNPCRCYTLPFTAVPCFSSAEQCCTSRRIAGAGHGMLCIAVPSPRAVPSRSAYALPSQAMPLISSAFFAITALLIALPQQYHAEQNQRGVMLNLAMPLPRKVQPRNALPMPGSVLLSDNEP